MRHLTYAVACLSTLTINAHAWGPEGHVIIAMIAEDRLSPEARKAERDILFGAPLATASIFADEYRVTHPETGRWHFVDIPEGETFDEARDCKTMVTGDCAIHEIEREKQIIKDIQAKPDKTDQDKYARADALKYLVHFVGDLHQPFHAEKRTDENGKSDDGGNSVKPVFFGDHHTNLHAVWDSGLILHADHPTAEDYVTYLKEHYLASMPETDWRKGSLADWAMESHDAAKAAYFNRGERIVDNTVLDQSYFDSNIGIVDRRLALAGARLAMILEDLLK